MQFYLNRLVQLLNSHVLNIESCRYFNIVRNERICTMSNKRAIEDEYHFYFRMGYKIFYLIPIKAPQGAKSLVQ